MMALIALSALGFGIVGLALHVRYREVSSWRRSLTAYQLTFPRGLSAETVSAWLGMLAAATRRHPVTLELCADHRGIRHYLLVPEKLRIGVLAQLRSALPGVRVEEAPAHLSKMPAWRLSREFRLTNRDHPLAHERAEATVGAVLALLHPLAGGEVVRISWTLSGARAPYLTADASAELKRVQRTKFKAPTFKAVGRVAVSAPTMGRAVNLISRIHNAWRVLDAPGVSVVRRWLPSRLVAARATSRRIPLAEWPVMINTWEALGLVGIPFGGVEVPGLSLGAARQLPPPARSSRRGLVILGHSNYPGMRDRVLGLPARERLHHTWIIGPTGVGKSTLIANMALQDIAGGSGLLLVDPKSDLVDEILSRLPEERSHDVVVIDPAATDRPVGFNILASPHGEHARELVVDNVVSIFAEIWKSSWGPRTADLLRSSLLTLASTRAPDGSAFTLAEAPELLTNPGFRRVIVNQPTVPESVGSFWLAFESMSDGERAQVIGPSLNKLRALTTRSSLRLLLGQSAGLDLSDVFTERRIVLVKLNKGIIGAESARLAGSLLVASFWQATMKRAATPQSKRRPAWAYLDEFQDVLRMGSSLEDALAQARGLGVGFVLAHQYIDQLPKPMRSAMFGTVRNVVAFQLGHEDARSMSRIFLPYLTTDDLMGQRAYEFAAKVSGAAPATGQTLPLGAEVRAAVTLAQLSRALHGVERVEVEAAMRARVKVSGRSRIGRETIT